MRYATKVPIMRMPGGSVPVALRPRALTKLTSDDESRILALIKKAAS